MADLKSVYIDRTGDWVRSGNNTGKFYLKSEVDMVIKELRYTLWLARAQRAADKQTYYSECKYDGWVHRVNVWLEVERKCLAKAEEYK